MPTFIPLTKPRPLPGTGQAIERPVLDCKEEPANSKFEMAKDVAAFANHLGGTLLVGAVESDEILRRYTGMTSKDAGKAIKDYSAAVADLCWPRPVFDPECYDDPSDQTKTKKIVVINVQPSLDLVSVKFKVDKEKGDWGGDAYVFPVRSGNHTRYLEPGQLAMFMTPQIRRVAVLISRIAQGSQVSITTSRNQNYKAIYKELREEDNLVLFNEPPNVPLDCVRTVYQQVSGSRAYWQINVDYGIR